MNLQSIFTNKKKRESWERIKELLKKIAEDQVELKESADMFRAIFCVSPVAMLVVGVEDAIIIDINQAFEELSGKTRDEVMGKTVFSANLYVDPDIRSEIVSRILANGYIKYYPVQFYVKGEPTDCFLSSKVLHSKGRNVMISVIDRADDWHRRKGD